MVPFLVGFNIQELFSALWICIHLGCFSLHLVWHGFSQLQEIYSLVSVHVGWWSHDFFMSWFRYRSIASGPWGDGNLMFKASEMSFLLDFINDIIFLSPCLSSTACTVYQISYMILISARYIILTNNLMIHISIYSIFQFFLSMNSLF